MALGKKKWIWCENCQTETWAGPVSGLMYQCWRCDVQISLPIAKRIQAEMRAGTRTRKQREMGTYLSNNARQQERAERGREVSKHYIWWVHTFQCLVKDCTRWPVHAHHVDRKSQGGSDRSAVPLCFEHHTGRQGVHTLGVKSFQEFYLIDLEREVEKLNDFYDSGILGPMYSRTGEFNERDAHHAN